MRGTLVGIYTLRYTLVYIPPDPEVYPGVYASLSPVGRYSLLPLTRW